MCKGWWLLFPMYVCSLSFYWLSLVLQWQGQYKSTLVCPICKKVSVTFDPFMYLSLPLPSTTMRTMTITVFSTDGTTEPSPYTVSVPKSGDTRTLINALSNACSLRDGERLLVAEVFITHSVLLSLRKLLNMPSTFPQWSTCRSTIIPLSGTWMNLLKSSPWLEMEIVWLHIDFQKTVKMLLLWSSEASVWSK